MPLYKTYCLGTVHILESFKSRCSPTEEQDYVALANAIIVSLYLIIFILSNIVLRIVFRNEEQDHFQDFKLKSVTIGIVFVLAALVISGLVLLWPDSDYGIETTYIIILVEIGTLMLYIIKENEFTFPYMLNLFPWSNCINSNLVAPLPPAVYPLQELNSRALQTRSSNQDCRVIDIEDDGGIFMG